MKEVTIKWPAGEPILKDIEKQKELNEKGYTVLPIIGKHILDELKKSYRLLHPVTPTGPIPGFYVSVHSSNLNYKLAVQQTIKAILEKYLSEIFTRYQCFVAAMQVKNAQKQSALDIHQDWNIVDEELYSSYGLWIPLVDIDASNGAIYFLNKSHRIKPTYRHILLPSIYSNVTNEIKDRLIPVFVKAGEPVLFNQAIVHFSPSNLSSEIRPSVVCTIASIDAKPIMYYPNSNSLNELLVYNVKSDYLQYYDNFFEDAKKLPESAKLADSTPVESNFIPLDSYQFIDLLNKL